MTGPEKEDEKVVVVSVEDNGSGIDPEIYPRLFTKFSSKSFSETGLGLFISKSIIEARPNIPQTLFSTILPIGIVGPSFFGIGANSHIISRLTPDNVNKVIRSEWLWRKLI